MATRRRIGVSIATTEAARRALMQPVPCWEKQWITTKVPGVNTKFKRWVKTDKTQQFSDDEGGADEPLAPLPDEVEVVEGDEELDQDEPAPSVGPELSEVLATDNADVAPSMPESQDISKPSSPKAQALSLQTDSVDPVTEEAVDSLDASLKPLDDNLEDVAEVADAAAGLNPEDVVDMDMSVLGPDGTAFESAHDLSQLEGPQDALMGGQIMDDSEDPFNANVPPNVPQ